jgi:hypothetical protein
MKDEWRATRLAYLSRKRRAAQQPKWLDLPPEKVPWERMRWLKLSADGWVMAPTVLKHAEAERWARAWAALQGGKPECIVVSTGETLVRVL